MGNSRGSVRLPCKDRSLPYQLIRVGRVATLYWAKGVKDRYLCQTMGVASFLMLGFILHFPTRVSTRSQSHSPLHTVSSLPSRPSSGIAALAVCAALFGSVRAQSVTLNSISIEGLDSQEGTIAYGEEGFVKISVEGYKGNELSAYQDQDKVHIVLSQKNDDDNWVDLTACRVFATKFQDCECDGDVEKLKITSFPLVRTHLFCLLSFFVYANAEKSPSRCKHETSNRCPKDFFNLFLIDRIFCVMHLRCASLQLVFLCAQVPKCYVTTRFFILLKFPCFAMARDEVKPTPFSALC